MNERERARASQRSRLLAAVTALVAARGYADVTVAAIAREAGVSLSTFYENFPDKQACLLAAYEDVTASLLTVIASSISTDAGWRQRIRDGIAAYIEWFIAHPEAAATFVVAVHTAGPATLARRAEVLVTFCRLIRDAAPVASELAALALVVALDGIVHEHLLRADLPALHDRCDELADLAMAMLTGSRQVTR